VVAVLTSRDTRDGGGQQLGSERRRKGVEQR
jgi:hypothetical protein